MIKFSEWPEVIASFVAGVTVEIVKTVTETDDLISPNARARNGYARGTKTTWSLVLWFEGHNLTEEYPYEIENPTFKTRTAAESYGWAQTLRMNLDGTYWDHLGDGGIVDLLTFVWLTREGVS